MPYDPNQDFIGRKVQIEELYQKLRTPGRFDHRVALVGLGGVGKTQIAMEYVYRYRYTGDYNHIFWIRAADRPTILSEFEKIGEQLGYNKNDHPLPAEEIAVLVLQWLKSTERWLLVIDNLDEIQVINNLLPIGNLHSHVLITTRNSHTLGIPARPIEVKVMSIDDAVAMLILRSKADEEPPERDEEAEPTVHPPSQDAEGRDEQTEARAIVSELGCLPLAIEQAAGYIREGPGSIFEFLSAYQESKDYLLARRPDANWIYEDTVATTWLVSLNTIQRRRPIAIKFMKLFAILDSEIPIRYLRDGAAGLNDELRNAVEHTVSFHDSLALLKSFSLIRTSKSPDLIVIHRLVQTVIRKDLDAQQMLGYKSDTVLLAHHAFHPSLDLYLSSVDRELYRIFRRQVMSCIGPANTENWIVMNDLLYRLKEMNGFDILYKNTIPLSEEVLQNCLSLGESDSRETMEAMYELGLDYRSEGEDVLALETFGKLFQKLEKIGVKPDDPLILKTERARQKTLTTISFYR